MRLCGRDVHTSDIVLNTSSERFHKHLFEYDFRNRHHHAILIETLHMYIFSTMPHSLQYVWSALSLVL